MSTATNSRLIPLTDHRGEPLVPEEDRYEPYPGSILLTDGQWGTAWQKHFADGRWHPCRGGASKTWAEIMARRNVVLVYDADERSSVRNVVVVYDADDERGE